MLSALTETALARKRKKRSTTFSQEERVSMK
jgi:hypothetical protein